MDLTKELPVEGEEVGGFDTIDPGEGIFQIPALHPVQQ